MTFDALSISEAQLRGVDLDRLRGESFSTVEHHRMVNSHEAYAKLYWQWVEFCREDQQAEIAVKASKVSPPKTRKKSIQRNRLVAKQKVSFTDTQIRIAVKAQQKNGK
jgi:hypothetical protein